MWRILHACLLRQISKWVKFNFTHLLICRNLNSTIVEVPELGVCVYTTCVYTSTQFWVLEALNSVTSLIKLSGLIKIFISMRRGDRFQNSPIVKALRHTCIRLQPPICMCLKMRLKYKRIRALERTVHVCYRLEIWNIPNLKVSSRYQWWYHAPPNEPWTAHSLNLRLVGFEALLP